MDRLIYTAVSGMNASMLRQRMIASEHGQCADHRLSSAETMQFDAANPDHVSQPIRPRRQSRSARDEPLGHGASGASMKARRGQSRPGARSTWPWKATTMLSLAGRPTAAKPIHGAAIFRSRRRACCRTAMAFRSWERTARSPCHAGIAGFDRARWRQCMVSEAGADPWPAGAVKVEPPQARQHCAEAKSKRASTGLFSVPDGDSGFGVLPLDDANARLMTRRARRVECRPVSEVLVDMIEAQRLL